jgi:hypothetical protein
VSWHLVLAVALVGLFAFTAAVWWLGERSAELDDREKALDDRAAHLAARAAEHAHTVIEVNWARTKLAIAADRERWLQAEVCRLHDELAARRTEYEESLTAIAEGDGPTGARVRASHVLDRLAGEDVLEAAGMPSSPVPHPRTVEIEGEVVS